jgi:hypothetical protein
MPPNPPSSFTGLPATHQDYPIFFLGSPGLPTLISWCQTLSPGTSSCSRYGYLKCEILHFYHDIYHMHQKVTLT